MVFFVSKRQMIPCLAAGLAALVLLSAAALKKDVSVMTQNQMIVSAKPVYILDAGHGGSDGGAVAQNGAVESQINLAVTLRTRDVFALLGIDAVLTRSDEGSLADDLSASLRAQKQSDTQNRVALINSIENARLISIHQNALPGQRQVHGAQVFYNQVPGSEEMAASFQATLNTAVNPNNKKNSKPISPDIYLMNHVNCPAVLIECGFLSNEEESVRLQDPAYQTLLAVAIVAAAMQT